MNDLRPGWYPMTRDADLEHTEEIIAARPPVAGKRVVMATSLTHPPVVDPTWIAIQPDENEADYIKRIWPDIPEEAY